MVKKTLNCNGKILDLSSPKIMGILNLNQDSFYDGGKYLGQDAIIAQVSKMQTDGMTILDLGPSSSKPGQSISNPADEIKILQETLALILKNFNDLIISVDTYHAKVAHWAINNGAHIINDISAGQIDAKMFEVVKSLNVPYIMMHMKGVPSNMQNQPCYEDLEKEVLDYFVDKVTYLKDQGVKDIVIDPGFGFGKTISDNYRLLKNMNVFKMLDVPILAGVSRKSMIYKVLETTPAEALNGTSVLNILALENGANILRVHDVKQAKETIKLYNYYNSI